MKSPALVAFLRHGYLALSAACCSNVGGAVWFGVTPDLLAGQVCRYGTSRPSIRVINQNLRGVIGWNRCRNKRNFEESAVVF